MLAIRWVSSNEGRTPPSACRRDKETTARQSIASPNDRPAEYRLAERSLNGFTSRLSGPMHPASSYRPWTSLILRSMMRPCSITFAFKSTLPISPSTSWST